MVGNRWYKCDLHVHSTASKCFKDREVTAEQWVDACLSKGIQCVALTDHNTGDNIDEYKIKAIEKGLIFFPGVEITCGDNGTHLLILFDLDAKTDTINDFLIESGINRGDFASDTARSPKSVSEIIDLATHRGAIVIPAHIDEYNGLSEVRNSLMKEVLAKQQINSVQLVQKEFYNLRNDTIKKEEWKELQDSISARYGNEIPQDTLKSWFNGVRESTEKNLSITTFSDNPHEEGNPEHGLWGIGTRYTYIKMSEKPMLKSLSDALLLGDLRVKPDFESSIIQKKEVILKNMTISDTELNIKPIKVDFSDDLTTIIGGRGTGKSCITRFLLYVLGKEDELKPFTEIESEFRKFAKLSDGQSGVLKQTTLVSLTVEFLEEVYLIERSLHCHTIKKVNSDSTYEEIDKTRLKMISEQINLYSQKQIYEISKNQDSIRDILDNYNKNKIEKVSSEINESRNKLIVTMREIDLLSKEILNLSQLKLKKEDFERKIAKLSKPEYKTTIDRNREFISEKTRISNDLSEIRMTIIEDTENLSDIAFAKTTIRNKEIVTHRNKLEEKILDHKKIIDVVLMSISQSIATYEKEIESSVWRKELLKNDKEYSNLKSALLVDELEMITNIDVLSKELKVVENEISTVENKVEKLEEEKINLIHLKEEYKLKRTNLSITREQFIDEIFKEVKGIQVKLIPCSDFSEYVKDIRNILGMNKTYDSIYSQLLTDFQRKKYTYEMFISDLKIIRDNNTSEIFTDTRFINTLNQIDNEKFIQIASTIPSDLIEISLLVNGKKVKLSNASAGQRTSAILTMILSYGKTPLIMDQPEDDLDSQLINSLIVNNIISKKQDRQIVIVTHNANIPVNGDSEFMICMGDTKKLSIEKSGSVDEFEIKDKICNVMEGGKDAFTNRARRYGFASVKY